jgi:nucleoside phosphorylase
MHVTHKTDREPDAVALPSRPEGAIGRRQEPASNANNDERTPSGAGERLGLDPRLTTVSVPVRAAGRRRRSTCRSGLVRLEEPRHRAGRHASLRVLSETPQPAGSAGLAAHPSNPITVAVFAALPEEREILARELSFSRPGRARELHGILPDGTPAILYGGRLMGRVPAAVETSDLLARYHGLSVILVVGLAGGFPEKDVRQGHLIVPATIYDLASRRISSADGETDSRVRPQAWAIDQKLGDYLESSIGEECLREACEKYGWPKDRRPVLRVGGAMVCLDEVVADDDFRRRLQATWGGQLLGIEMESGGVIAAARRFRGFSFPVFQIRAVADTADPAKSDDQWRMLGIQTICSIVRRIRWHDMFAAA